MVAQPYFSSRTTEDQEIRSPDFRWTNVNLQEVVETNYRRTYASAIFRIGDFSR